MFKYFRRKLRANTGCLDLMSKKYKDLKSFPGFFVRKFSITLPSKTFDVLFAATTIACFFDRILKIYFEFRNYIFMKIFWVAVTFQLLTKVIY